MRCGAVERAFVDLRSKSYRTARRALALWDDLEMRLRIFNCERPGPYSRFKSDRASALMLRTPVRIAGSGSTRNFAECVEGSGSPPGT